MANVVALRQVREDELDALKARLARHLPHSIVVYGGLSLAARYGLHSFRPASILVPVGQHPSCFTIIAPIGSGVSIYRARSQCLSTLPSSEYIGRQAAGVTAEGEQLFMVWDNKAERATLQDPQCIEVFWSPEEHTVKDVAQYLSLIPDLDWSQPKALIGLPRILLPEIQSLDSIGGRQVQVHVKRKGHVYNLEAPAILDTELPPEYHISSLNENEASVVWTNWEFNFLDSEDNIRHDIAHFPSSGIRKRSLTDSAGSPQEAAKETLVSWVRTTKNGWMGNTFTLPRHRRKGLASRATLALAHQMLQEGFFAIVVIEDFNAASAKFHESLGFKRLCAIAMAVLVPAETTGQDCLE